MASLRAASSARSNHKASSSARSSSQRSLILMNSTMIFRSDCYQRGAAMLFFYMLAIAAIYDANDKKKPALTLLVAALVIGSIEVFK